MDTSAATGHGNDHARPPAHGEGREDERPGPNALVDLIRASVIGDDEAVAGPYGIRRVTYADYTASGRSLTFLEDYIRDAVLPLYANTHTESSGTGLQTSRFREEARRLVLEGCGGNPAAHAVIFCGSGSTAAINRMVDVLGLRLPASLDDRWKLRSMIPADQRPVVFIGPYEHHSNELPWRESIADVVTIHEDHDGYIDLHQLEEELVRFASRPLRIGSFSAASNVTGIVSNTHTISRLLHAHGALSFFDFAAAAPYVSIEMDPAGDPLAYKDAVFISPHKFIGGPGTPGVLVARRELFTNRVPSMPGGGTVAYVNAETHVYVDDIEHREEGGTPAIVESIRAGLVFQLKAAVGAQAIRERETDFIHRALHRWEANPAIEILGSHEAERLSIVSFVVRHRGRHLHHNFVVALLNDLFGIQSRGGCSCAGPYGHRLLGIDIETSHGFQREIARGCEGIRPGWVRVNFNYFISEAVFEFVLAAVDLVASEGWRLLPDYAFEPATGLWRHRAGLPEPPLSLRGISYADARMAYASHRHLEPESRLADYLAEARERLAQPPGPVVAPTYAADAVGPDFDALRWFLLPEDVAAPTGGVTERAVLGLDLGTTEAKALLVTLDGRVLGLGRGPIVTDLGPDGRAEQDPRAWWAAIAVATRQATTASRASGEVDVLAVGGVGQGPTLAAVDERGSPVRPAITWQDRRVTGGGFGLLPKLAWLAGADPGAGARARWLLASWDALGLWLSGEAATTLQGHESPISAGELEAVGLRADQLGPPVPYGSRLGGLRVEAAEALGLPPGLPVVAGVNDGTASMLGAGLRLPGDAVDTGGTSGGIGIYTDRAVAVPGLFVAPAPLAGRWVVGGAMAATGAAVDWIRSVAGGWTSDELFAAAASVPPGADGLVFLPYLVGERAPLFDERARGAFVGLTLGHGRPHLARAVLEGAAFALRHVAEPLVAAGAPVRELRLAGRSSPGDLWAQIKADVLGVPAAIPSVGHTAVLGAAILAAWGVRAVADLEAGVASMTSIDRRLAPDAGAGARYDELFEVYRSLYPALAPAMHALGD